MLFGIDSHAAEREGDGNSTYTRGLVRGMLGLAGPGGLGPGERLALFAATPGHPFYHALAAGDRARVIRAMAGGGVARLAWTLGRAARRAGVGTLHTQYFAPAGYRGPLVLTVHDLGFLHVPESFPLSHRLVMRACIPPSLRRAERILTVSDFSRRDLIARYRVPPEKILITPLAAGAHFGPLDPEEVAKVLARYGIEPGYLFSVGRLNRRKNLGRLLQAHARLQAAGRRVPLVIAGKPDHGAGDLIRATRRGGDAGVRWMGLIPEEDLPAFYAGASCFVYPSLFEGFGLPLLEAMQSGCPVVASDRTACPEVVGDAGVVVDAGRTDAIAEGIERVLADRGLREELRARGLARSRRFTWEETARRTLAVYREVGGRGA